MPKTSDCPHVSVVSEHISWEEIHKKREGQQCVSCGEKAPNLWLCLVGPCSFIGCGESAKDHSAEHAEDYNHYLTINLTTMRIWCYSCENEVLPHRNSPPLLIPDRAFRYVHSLPRRASTDSSPQRSLSGADDSESDMEDDTIKPRGLTGLQNLGNTCYMNSAIQALSNCPPLTRFFLDCCGFVRSDKNPMLSRHYLRLISELWHKKRPSYVVPNGIASGIKVVHPMFRGYSQQDTQEFLRCFMDQLHEELKQQVCDLNGETMGNESFEEPLSKSHINSHDRQPSIDSSSSQSDYETCDSGVSSERGSLEPNVSSDENSDANEHMQLQKILEQENKRETPVESKAKTESSAAADNKEALAAPTKEMKDTVNMLCKQGGDNNHAMEQTSKLDAMEFTDAVSEAENTDKMKSSWTKQAETSECGTLQSHKSTQSLNIGAAVGQKVKRNVHHQSVISDIFDGKILSSVQCLTCERISTTREIFQDLSLPIPSKDHLHMLHSTAAGNKSGACGEVNQGWLSWMFTWMKSWFVGPTITLKDCLAAFFSADELKGDNMYSCEKCKKLRNGMKYSKVLRLPEVLCIHLKRFRHEFYSSKINSYVSFPLEGLDMKPYLHKDCKDEVTSFDLVAVICHHGTAGGGHYTAYCLNYINEQWYEFDDQFVTEVDIQQVVNCGAYVLFYRDHTSVVPCPTTVKTLHRKQNDHMINLRQKAMTLMDEREPSLLQFYVSKQWINRFNTFAEPGPITNEDFLCHHGGVPPDKCNHVEEMVVALHQPVWQFLHERFGGGPACTHLTACTICEVELEKLRYRQKFEMESFIQLNEKFRQDDDPSIIYAISMAWFKEWESFVRMKTDNPPGPIDNSCITVVKNGQQVVKTSSDYGQLSKDMWCFLCNIYGGEAEVILRQHVPPPPPQPLLPPTKEETTTAAPSPPPVSEEKREETKTPPNTEDTRL